MNNFFFLRKKCMLGSLLFIKRYNADQYVNSHIWRSVKMILWISCSIFIMACMCSLWYLSAQMLSWILICLCNFYINASFISAVCDQQRQWKWKFLMVERRIFCEDCVVIIWLFRKRVEMATMQKTFCRENMQTIYRGYGICSMWCI